MQNTGIGQSLIHRNPQLNKGKESSSILIYHRELMQNLQSKNTNPRKLLKEKKNLI